MAGGLPTGTTTFLFTDIEGSTRRWETDPDGMARALARHDELLRDAIQRHAGAVFATGGDGFAAAFGTSDDAVAAAVDAQRALRDDRAAGALAVRMGIHSGTAERRDDDYFGIEVNRAARLMAIGHGAQILVSDSAAGLLVDTTVLRNLGHHRLRDLSRPIGVHQVAVDGLHVDFPPLRDIDSYAGNLPVQLSSFVGRTEELADVVGRIRTRRLVTLIGAGGTGKTRLALQAAADVVEDFADGVWFADLSLAGPGGAVVEVVAGALGVQRAEARPLIDSIVERVSSRQLLLVVDNCEHVIDDAAALVELVLRAGGGTRILATSREAMATEGEECVPLPPLGVGDGAGDAVDLFVQRVAAERGMYDPDETERADIARLCRQLDGMPLAIELAASRCRTFGVREVAARLDERFRLLGGGRRRVPRHQTLQAAVDWSYELLTERERRAFDLLSVFVGGFEIDDAAAILGSEGFDELDCLDLLASLVEKSMCTADTEREPTTYRYLETLRAYGLRNLSDLDQLDESCARHAEHFAQMAWKAAEEMIGPDELLAHRALDSRWPDLRAAFDWALEGGRADELEAIAELAIVIAWRGTFEPFGWFAEHKDEVTGSLAREAAVSGVFILERDLSTVLEEFGEVEAEWSADRPPLALLMAAGWSQLGTGDVEGCLATMERLHRIARDAGGPRCGVAARWPLALARSIVGLDPSELATEIIQLGEDAAWATGVAFGHHALGASLRYAAPREAVERFREAARLAESVGNDLVMLSARGDHLGLEIRLLELDDKERDLADLLRHNQRTSNSASAASALPYVASLLLHRGRAIEAARLHSWFALNGQTNPTTEDLGPAIEAAVGSLDAVRSEVAGLDVSEIVELACQMLERPLGDLAEP